MMNFWQHVQSLAGKTLRTLARNLAFDIVDVTNTTVTIRPQSTGKVRAISKQEIDPAFVELQMHGEITRVEIEERFSPRNPAYVAAILAQHPEVSFTKHPVITLLHEGLSQVLSPERDGGNLIPCKQQLQDGMDAYAQHEPREAMYKVATFLVEEFWGQPEEMADGLGVLLLTWNNAFYRFGPFDFYKLEAAIREDFPILEVFRTRAIKSFGTADEQVIIGTFNRFLEALAIDSGKARGRKSPVAVAKTLHLLAPHFFPLWDKEIAGALKCDYGTRPGEAYIHFLKIMKEAAQAVTGYTLASDKSILKLLDEYYYSRFTKGWITKREDALC